MALAVFEEWHQCIDIVFSFVLAGKADVRIQAGRIDIRSRFMAKIEAADGCVRHESTRSCRISVHCLFVIFCRHVGRIPKCLNGSFPCFGEEFRVRKEGWYAVLRNFEDDLVSVFPDIHFSSEERSVRDRAAAAHHAIVCVLSCKAAPAVDQRDRIAGAHLYGVVDGCPDGCTADVSRACHGQDRFSCRRIFRDIETQILEITELVYDYAFRIEIQCIAAAVIRETAIEPGI